MNKSFLLFITLLILTLATAKRCGKGKGECPEGECCSKFGFCGKSKTYCGKGCQSKYGICDGDKNDEKLAEKIIEEVDEIMDGLDSDKIEEVNEAIENAVDDIDLDSDPEVDVDDDDAVEVDDQNEEDGDEIDVDGDGNNDEDSQSEDEVTEIVITVTSTVTEIPTEVTGGDDNNNNDNNDVTPTVTETPTDVTGGDDNNNDDNNDGDDNNNDDNNDGDDNNNDDNNDGDDNNNDDNNDGDDNNNDDNNDGDDNNNDDNNDDEPDCSKPENKNLPECAPDCSKPENKNLPECAPDCSKPENASLPECAPDCSKPENASLPECAPDCSRPENASLPECAPDCTKPENAGLPECNVDCSKPENIDLPECAVDCTKPEYANLPECAEEETTSQVPEQTTTQAPTTTTQAPTTTTQAPQQTGGSGGCSTDAFGIASKFNGFFFGDFTGYSADVQGRLAAKGTINISGGYQNNAFVFDPVKHSTQSNYKCNESPLKNEFQYAIVAGTLNFKDGGEISNGGVAYLNSANMPSYISDSIKNHNCKNEKKSVIDFDSERQKLINLSKKLAGTSAKCKTTIQWGTVTVDLVKGEKTCIVNLDSFNNLYTFKINENGADVNDISIVFNINGNSVNFTNFDLFSINQYASRILWNVPNASKVLVQNFRIQGSLLAPTADIEGTNGNIQGMMIGNSFKGNLQMDWVPFYGCV